MYDFDYCICSSTILEYGRIDINKQTWNSLPAKNDHFESSATLKLVLQSA